MNYGTELVKQTLGDLGISYRKTSEGWAVAKCPMHSDSSPSFAINLDSGGWICYAGCGSSADLAVLIWKVNGGNLQEIRTRLTSHLVNDLDLLRRALLPEPEEKEEEYKEPIFYDRHKMYPYMFRRGFTKEILKEWAVGIDSLTKSVAIPVTVDGALVGLVRRSVEGPKVFKNSVGLDTDLLLFGLDRVPESFTTVIVVESPLDVIWLSQHGIHNAVATFGGTLTPQQAALLLKRFRTIILAFDNDAGGAKFRAQAKHLLVGRIILEDVYFPEGAKDANDCTAEQLAILFKLGYNNETERNLIPQLPDSMGAANQ